MSIFFRLFKIRQRVPEALREHYYGAPRKGRPNKSRAWATSPLSRPRDHNEVPQAPIVEVKVNEPNP